MKRIAILGSTGSIGQQTLAVVRALSQHFTVTGLAAGNNTGLLAKQIDEFKPGFVYCRNNKLVPSSSNGYETLSMEDIAIHPLMDIVVIATSGKAGLGPVLAAVKAGKRIALANKESIVMAGEIITREADISGAQIMPIDSEHSAIWQCLNGEIQPAARIILTASGGPFRSYSTARMEDITVEQALKHPSWRMGKKVTIDSATLMNKGLEVIEAHWLFKMAIDNIKVLVHPQSIIHSMVEFIDGSTKAQLSCPDMRLPIQYALTHPERQPNPQLPLIDWSNTDKLTFEQPDLDIFPCLKLAIEVGKKGGTYPAVLCAADEVAVDFFLSERIRFVDIARLIGQVIEEHKAIINPGLEEILAADNWARQRIHNIVSGVNP